MHFDRLEAVLVVSLTLFSAVFLLCPHLPISVSVIPAQLGLLVALADAPRCQPSRVFWSPVMAFLWSLGFSWHRLGLSLEGAPSAAWLSLSPWRRGSLGCFEPMRLAPSVRGGTQVGRGAMKPLHLTWSEHRLLSQFADR